MMLTMIALAAQAAASRAPAQANPDQQARQALAARGVSAAGVNTILTLQHRHDGAVAAIVQRGRAAEQAMRAALLKRPIDIDGFARAIAARNEAGLALQREGADVTVQQLRALSPADRIILANALTGPAPAPARK